MLIFDPSPGAYWAESFPLLKFVPDCLAPWKREVKQHAESSSQLLLDLVIDVKKRMEKGDTPPSFTKNLWTKHDQNPGELTEREIAYATGSLFGAGSDTSSSTLMTFTLAMTVFPHVAAKAQEELDRVVGRERSPTWSDQPNLPYCMAVIKETLRWRPVAVMGGTPHASIKDDHYQGHFIPKGTTIMGNLWAIHHNERYFHDSQNFIPERYLEVQEGLEPYPNRDGHSAFGWVRTASFQFCRICQLIFICGIGPTHMPREAACRKLTIYLNNTNPMGLRYRKGTGSSNGKGAQIRHIRIHRWVQLSAAPIPMHHHCTLAADTGNHPEGC